MAYWDGHRGQVPLLSPGLYLTCVSVVLGVAGILLFRREGDGHGVFVMRAFVVTGTLGMLACVTTWFPGLLPDIVSTVMPGRFVNASIYAYAALLLGLMGRFRHRFACQLLMLVHLLYVPWNWFFLQFLSSDKYGWQLAHWKEFVACAAVLMCLLAFKAPTARVQGKGSPARWFTAALASMVLLILGGIAALDGARRMTSDSLFEDDAVLATASEGQGMLIGGPSMELVQLRTGRPVLLNTGGLDQLPFVPSSGPEMNRVLKGVYGIDLLDPPEDIKRHRPGALLPNSSRQLWESRSSEEWQVIRSEFGATEVLASADWELDLPVVVRNGRYALYRIPETNRDSNHF